MKVLSFMRSGSELAPVEVELSLSPGLPQILFLGLPDAALKESALRIRSALREQGFQFPQTHQVLVHLKPTHLRKSSRGLDLAVAAALLWETGQLEPPSEIRSGKAPVLYGELTLKGDVVQPDDLADIDGEEDLVVTTGPGAPLSYATRQVSCLKGLLEPDFVRASEETTSWMRPVPRVREFPEPAARLAMVIAAGEHAALLAGPPGSGKSTLVEEIPSWLEEPDDIDGKLAKKIARKTGRELQWRPVLRPHHSITPLAMIGGGSSLWSGEITRAHSGVMILDEMLEFHPKIQEALREPIETGQISIVRAGRAQTFPARVLLLGTTNLCPCGRYVPKRDSISCRCSKADLRRYLGRLSGPFVDRFAIFSLTDEWSSGTRTVGVQEVSARVHAAIVFRRERRGQLVPNSRVSGAEIEATLSGFQREHLFKGLFQDLGSSRRRTYAVLQVARTLSDLRGSDTIGNDDLEEAMELSVRTHRRVMEWEG